jgi:hypothetical protein
METQSFQLGSPAVVHETIDGEVIMVNLDTGCYYSLEGAGAVMWEHLTQGASLARAAEAVERHYAASDGDLESALQRLVAELLAENLLKPRDAGAAPASLPDLPAADGKRPFVAPVLNKHTDMQDLLLLDPIHEVDEAGWPSARP